MCCAPRSFRNLRTCSPMCSMQLKLATASGVKHHHDSTAVDPTMGQCNGSYWCRLTRTYVPPYPGSTHAPERTKNGRYGAPAGVISGSTQALGSVSQLSQPCSRSRSRGRLIDRPLRPPLKPQSPGYSSASPSKIIIAPRFYVCPGSSHLRLPAHRKPTNDRTRRPSCASDRPSPWRRN